MKCEQVRALLSAYLDQQLAAAEQAEIAAHVRTCDECSIVLVDLRRFDALIAHLPRVEPDDALRESIFSSAEYQELTGTFGATGATSLTNQPALPISRLYKHRSPVGRPYLVALPTTEPPHSPSLPTLPMGRPVRIKHLPLSRLWLSTAILLLLSLGGLISWKIWEQQASHAAYTQQTSDDLPTGPLPAGTRGVFLRDGALWSAPTDGTGQVTRLTRKTLSVAENWQVRPPAVGRNAGNMLAYIDLQEARVHVIRGDGQQDKTLPQPLLPAGTIPNRVWDTTTGAAILTSLAWSNDGAMLAFVSGIQGTDQTTLYIYTLSSDTLQTVPLPQNGLVQHPRWSPDSRRVAFEFQQGTARGILDYHVQNHGLLIIADNVATSTSPADSVLTLGWSPDINKPALTWSVGQMGEVHSIWRQRVGVEPGASPQLLTRGTYAQANYSATSYDGTGGWLLVNQQVGEIATVSLASTFNTLVQSAHISMAQWSPDGSKISYLAATDTPEMGSFHVLQNNSGTDILVASHVMTLPPPIWSPDSKRLAYNTANATQVVTIQSPRTAQPLPLQGPANSFSWSITTPTQLLVTMQEEQTGLYLVDVENTTAIRLDARAPQGPLLWTQIP